MPDKQKDKPRLVLLGKDPTPEQVGEFYEKLTGRNPTKEEMEKLKKRMEKKM
jgi:hypothetical protein